MAQLFQKKNSPNIVVIGGGTGVFTVLSGFRKYNANLAAIVSMADDGGSSGVLREEFGILPPGDIRRALVALSSHPRQTLAKLFSYRFSEGTLAGHAFGNLVLTALERSTGSFEKAVSEAARLLDVQGEVLPVTLDTSRLHAKLEDGSIIEGETNIDIPKHDGKLKIKKIWLEPEANINPKVIDALASADMIILGPGDLYTSVLPNLLVTGVPEAIKKSKAKKVYVCNIMTKNGETHGFQASDFVRKVEEYLGKGVINNILVNIKKPPTKILARYKKENAFFVTPNSKGKLAVYDNFLRKGALIRHDSQKLAQTIFGLL